MAVKLIKLKCPDCGASLEFEADREQAFCSYCGAKILIHNENEYIYRNIDEAEIEMAKAKKEIRLKELEVQKTKTNLLKWAVIVYSAIVAVMAATGFIGNAVGNENLSSWLFPAEMLFLFGVFGAFMYFMSYSEKNDGKIKLPQCIEEYKQYDYNSMVQALRDAGFTNIKTLPRKDLKYGIFKGEGQISKITIDGGTSFSQGSRFRYDVPIVISYHSRME